MENLTYGSQGQVSFPDWHQYYYALGFLANPQNAEIRWENNEEQGAWGSEGRIHCLVPESCFPQNFRFTAGRGNIYARINCNDYVGVLVKQHRFNYNSRGQNVDAIVATVPDEYRQDFMDGYGQRFFASPTHIAPVITQIHQRQAPVSNREPIKGDSVLHTSWGIGTVTKMANGLIYIKFGRDEKSYKYPDAFEIGSLKKI